MVNLDLDRQNWPKIVAHRGSSRLRPENTLEAFELAIEAGTDVVELDVRLTADNVPVVMHDLDVSRTTDGTGWLHEMTLVEVKALSVKRKRGPRAEVPTVREALQVLAGRADVNLEVKNIPGEPSFDSPVEAAAEHAVRLVEEFAQEATALISSFNWLSIERARELNPDIATGFLTIAAIDPMAALLYARSKGHRFVLPQSPAAFAGGPELVRQAHDAGIRVGTWTVDDPEGLERLFSFGVDAIATNRPEVAVPIRDAFRERARAEADG
jgi:glycerophosphoryl diester phosphodiesterase